MLLTWTLFVFCRADRDFPVRADVIQVGKIIDGNGIGKSPGIDGDCLKIVNVERCFMLGHDRPVGGGPGWQRHVGRGMHTDMRKGNANRISPMSKHRLRSRRMSSRLCRARCEHKNLSNRDAEFFISDCLGNTK